MLVYKRQKERGRGENDIVRSFINCTRHVTLHDHFKMANAEGVCVCDDPELRAVRRKSE